MREWRHSYLLAVVAISLAGLILRAPVLRTGFIVDDYAQLSMMAGTYPVARSPLALFTFTNGEPDENQALKDVGFFPWWSHQRLKIALFRPLASALMWVDHWVLGRSAWLYHLHSAGWWISMSVTWGLVLRRFLPWTWALLAHVLCVCHPANGMLLGWIANRNASVAMFFGLLALSLQVSRDEYAEHKQVHQILIPVCWGLSLLAGEYGMSMLMYCVAYEVMHSQSSQHAWTRLRTCLGVVLGYVALRSLLSFGSRESGMYIDPIREPWAFVSAVAVRGPILAGDLVLGLRSNWWSAGYPWAEPLRRALGLGSEWSLDLQPMRHVHLAFGLLAIVISASMIWSRRQWDSKVRFAALALPFSVLLTAAGTPESRILLPALFGWTLLLVETLFLMRQRSSQHKGSRISIFFACGLGIAEAAASWHYSAEDQRFLPQVAAAVRASILAPELDRVLPEVDDAFLIAAVDPTTTIYIPMLRRWHGRAGPTRCHLLMSTASPVRLERLSSNEFRLTRQHSYRTGPDVYGDAFRREALQVGQVFSTRWLRATVERVHNGMATMVRFQAARHLDGPAVTLLVQGVSGLLPMAFPPPGQSLALPSPVLPFSLMRQPGDGPVH